MLAYVPLNDVGDIYDGAALFTLLNVRSQIK